MVQAVRGAVQIKTDLPEKIIDGVGRMVQSILSKNKIHQDELISIQFSITEDLKSKNPAGALRVLGFSDVPLFCCVEPECDGMLPRMVRTIIMFNTEKKRNVQPIYLDGAQKLRPDLFT